MKKFDFQTYHAIMFKRLCFQQVEQTSHKETGRYGAFKSGEGGASIELSKTLPGEDLQPTSPNKDFKTTF